ncbi:unnamed protein product [Calypogeia fissa]
MEGVSWKVYLLLLGSFICSAFTGFQSIVILEWLQPLLLLQFLHQVKVLERKLGSMLGLLFLVLVIQTLGYTIAYAAIFNDPYFTFSGVLEVACVSLIAWIALLFVFVTCMYYEQRFPEAVFSHPFAFPVVWMSMWHASSSFSPIGATGNPAYTQHGIQPLVLTTALWGLDGIVFLMTWTASLVHQRLQLRQETGANPWTVTLGGGNLDDDDIEADSDTYSNGGEGSRRLGQKVSPKEFAKKVQRHDKLVTIWCSFLIFSLLFSGTKEVFFSGKFFERGIVDTIRPTVPVSCILRQPSALAETESLTSEFLWNATSERVKAGDAIIVWSETATVVYGQEGEDELLSRARELLSLEQEKRAHLQLKSGDKKILSAVEGGPYLGLSYAKIIDGKKYLDPQSQYNMFTFMAPDGSVGFQYEKTNPVPFVEKETIPGPGKLKAVDTPFGTVSAAICFDYQFPRLLEQASYLGADIMIQPSWTWGPAADSEFKSNAFRAVENGFTMLRCSSEGASGVVTPNYEFVELRESTTTSVETMVLPISGKVFTLFPYGGFLFGILVAVAGAKYMFMSWLPLTWVLAVSNFFPGAVNTFFVGDKFEEDRIGKKTYRRYMTRSRNSTKWEVAKRPFFASSE